MTNEAADLAYRQKPAEPSLVRPIGLFAGLAALNFFRIGYQLVVAAWSAVQLTGRADAAGMILLISTLANLLGRFRANGLFITSSVGLLIFATPTLYAGAAASALYLVMAGVVAVSAIGLLLLTKPNGCSEA